MSIRCQSSSSPLREPSQYINNSSYPHRIEQDDNNSLTVSEVGNRQKLSKYLHNKILLFFYYITY